MSNILAEQSNAHRAPSPHGFADNFLNVNARVHAQTLDSREAGRKAGVAICQAYSKEIVSAAGGRTLASREMQQSIYGRCLPDGAWERLPLAVRLAHLPEVVRHGLFCIECGRWFLCAGLLHGWGFLLLRSALGGM